jgi:predicted phosphodiesterase/biotin operon repressor
VTAPGWWTTDADRLKAEVHKHGSFRQAERAHGLSGAGDTFSKWWKRHGLPAVDPRKPATESPIERLAQSAPGVDLEQLLSALRRAKGGATVATLADEVDASPRRVQTALEELRKQGYRVDLSDEHAIRLDRVSPSKTKVHPGLLPLLDGTLFRFGVVSDTHLSSNEEALAELHAAYDYFAQEGITTVLHAGDWTTGRGVFPNQDSEIKVHDVSKQARRLVDEYPLRDGITTIGIAGNHDLEGAAGRIGFDPVYHLAAAREDIIYLEGMSAWVEIGAEELGDSAPYVHLLHGKGGMSYAVSYKAQKLVDGYPSGRKPAILIPGHWHVRGQFEARGVQVLFPGCFEWQSPFMARLGLHPAVGFHVVEATIAGDGSVVGFMARWLRYWEGRVVG